MRAGERMRRAPVTIGPGDSLDDAGRRMGRHGLGQLPVVQGSRLVGMLDDHDLASAHPSAATTLTFREILARLAGTAVARALTREIVAVGPRTPIAAAARLMRARHLTALPLIRGDELLGLVTEDDPLELLVELLSAGGPG